MCRGGAPSNMIILGASIPPRRQATIIKYYVNGEGRVIMIIYPGKIYPPQIATSGEDLVFPIDEQHERKGSVDDVAERNRSVITTRKKE